MKLLLFMPATRVRVCLGSLLLSACMVSAQPTEVTDPIPLDPSGLPLDDITNRAVIAEHAVMRYAPLRESDILWEKRIWRVIDLREKMNFPFAYPFAPLAQIFGEAAFSGELTVYDPEDDHFSKPMRVEQLSKSIFKDDTLVTVNVETGEEEIKIVRNEPNWESVKRFRLKEAWFFDTRTATLRCRILGIAPLMNVTNSNGDFLYERPMFWVHYPTARPLLARQKAYTLEGNLSATTTLEDMFEMRRFASVVYKENNPYDRRIEDYLTGVDGLMEAGRIKDALFNLEHDLWQW